MMYRRYTSEAVKVEADTTTLLGVTYMRFKNTRSGNKWFYAFVTAIDYVNEHTSIVYYEIDVMQTWFIQGGSVRPCMVLREHVSDDTFGTNLEAEPTGSSVYDSEELTSFNEFGEYNIVAQTTGLSAADERIVQGLFTGCNYYTHKAETTGDGNQIYSDISNMLGSWSQQLQEQDVVDLFTVPSFLVSQTDTTKIRPSIREIVPADTINRPTKYDSYTPKNKKMFMYPYSYLMCTTHTGDAGIYRWEYFDSSTPEFKARGTFLGGGEICCFPMAYNGQTENIDAGLTMNNFPKNAFAYDAYQAWIASGGTTRLSNDRVVASVKGVAGILPNIGGLVRTLTGNGGASQSVSTTYEPSGTKLNGQPIMSPVSSQVTTRSSTPSAGASAGFVGGLLSGVGNLIEARNNLQYQFNDASYQPNVLAGKQTCNLAVALRDANFYFYHVHVRDSEAKRIDDFFSCYGYSVNKVKTPNLTGRRYWNFVQTEGAVISGDMPSSSKEAIGRILDSGITFWHNGDNVGNYAQSVTDGSINNPIVS